MATARVEATTAAAAAAPPPPPAAAAAAAVTEDNDLDAAGKGAVRPVSDALFPRGGEQEPLVAGGGDGFLLRSSLSLSLRRDGGGEGVFRPEESPGDRPLERTLVAWSRASLPTSAALWVA